ncbi:MAG TPA: DUF3883 domain-containing protein [Rhizomicrobium sp.]
MRGGIATQAAVGARNGAAMARRAYVLWIKPNRVDRVEEALASNQLILGWSEAEGLLDPNLDEDDFRRIVHDTYHADEPTKRKAGRAAPHLWRFIREMHADDLVLVPRHSGVYMARVLSGPSFFSPGKRSEDTAYRRSVEWLNGGKPFPRTAFGADLQARLKRQRDTSGEISEYLAELEKILDAGTSGGDWTAAEVGAVVADYRDMLLMELSGAAYSKTEHRRKLMGRVARSEGSIEFKHQNISAVLEETGQPWIRGYKPRHNFQASLVEAVGRIVLPALEAVLPLSVPEAGINPEEVFVPPPKPAEDAAETPAVARLARKIDQGERDRRNRALGTAGEEFVFRLELERLADIPRLAGAVRWVSRDEGDGHGYDIASYERDGREMFIEVKTTRGGIRTPFFLSSNEIAAADDYGDRYRLYRVFEYGPSPRVYRLTPPLRDSVELTPSVFKARPK